MNEQPESIQDFCSKIDEDSEKEISGIIERAEYTAKARAGQILKEAEEKRKAILQKASEESEASRRIILSDLNLELRKVGLRIRGDIVEDAIAALRDRLSQYRSSSEYAEFFAELALEGIAVLGEDEVVLKPGDSDKDLLTEKLLKNIRSRARELLGKEIRISVDENTLKNQAGLHVVARGGSMLFDNTIESRINRMGDDLRLLIVREIFG